MDMFKAAVDGFSDRLFEYQVLAVHVGFWSGYYSNASHPRSLDSVVTSMRNKHKANGQGQVHSEDVDVEAFLAMERRFQEQLQR